MKKKTAKVLATEIAGRLSQLGVPEKVIMSGILTSVCSGDEILIVVGKQDEPLVLMTYRKDASAEAVRNFVLERLSKGE